MILKFLSYSFIILPFLFLSSCNSNKKQEMKLIQKNGAARPPITADAYVVKTKMLFDKLEVPGSIVANEAAEIHPEVTGRITGIYFKEGSFVRKGALLVKLNDADLQAQKQKLVVQLKISKQNENRSAQLLKIQGISRQDYETQQLQVSNVYADLAVINTQIEKTNIRAPFNGKLGLRMVSPGAYVSPTTILTTISQMNQLRVDFTIPEKYTRQMNIGQYINFTVEGSKRNYTAKVIATESNITEATRTLQVRAALQGDQSGLVPGKFAIVTLNFEPDPNSIVVPSQAIIPQARGKKVYVYNNGKAKFVDVTTGLRDSATVQVTSGLKAGDTVLTSSLLTLKPDANVVLGKVVNETSSSKEEKKSKP